jgi:hypothetical protein
MKLFKEYDDPVDMSLNGCKYWMAYFAVDRKYERSVSSIYPVEVVILINELPKRSKDDEYRRVSVRIIDTEGNLIFIGIQVSIKLTMYWEDNSPNSRLQFFNTKEEAVDFYNRRIKKCQESMEDKIKDLNKYIIK